MGYFLSFVIPVVRFIEWLRQQFKLYSVENTATLFMSTPAHFPS